MIEIKNIKKSFDGKSVLKGISTIFKSGACNMIIGGSGSGKTTLIKCMVGLHEVDSGGVLYDGRDFTKCDFNDRIPIRKEIGMLFQGSALFDSSNVQDNVMFAMNMFTNMSYGEKMDRVNFCLNRVNLENVNKKFPAELSGGMKKRVGIARAIAMQPKYLYCDEPNSGLDPKTSIVIDNLIHEITVEYGITTIVNTHDMNSVMEVGDNVLFINQGKKEWEGSNEEIKHADNELLNDFVFASKHFKDLQKKEVIVNYQLLINN